MGKNKKKTAAPTPKAADQQTQSKEETKLEKEEAPPKQEVAEKKPKEDKKANDKKGPQMEPQEKEVEKKPQETAEVDAEVAEEAQVEEQKLVNITMVDLNNRKINLKMVQYELILELREFLGEHVYTCFFTNYFLEHMGKKLSDYSDLSELDLETDSCIYMRPKLYDEKSARQHIKRVNDILTTPCVLNAQQNTPEEDKLNEIFEQGKKDGISEEDILKKQEDIFKTIQEKQEQKQKSLYENFMKIVEQDQGNQYIQPNNSGAFQSNSDAIKQTENKEDKDQPAGQQSTLMDIYSSTIEKQMNKELTSNKYVKTLEQISYSSFNPVPAARKLAGDLFYLSVKTLDAGEKGITCCVNGFYVNESVEKGAFSPGPSQKRNAQGKQTGAFSYTLIGCLNQISPSFGKNLQKYMNQILNTEQYFLTNPNVPVYHWTSFDDKLLNNSCDQNQLSEVVNPLYGLDPKGIRDWNEEFQVVKDFPKENMAQRAQRDRAVQKIYNDFLNAATQGAIAIIKGNLTPLNPNESKMQQVFVYNYIFFSYALDCQEDFKDLSSSESNPSWTQANHDMTGLRNLQVLEVEGLNYLATTVVNYRGHRIICQSIIPGILNNSELASLAEYGTVDDQKTIQANEEFHKMMIQVCEKMNIQKNNVIDGEGKEIEIAGCVEIKGIRGTDKRRYIVDLQGMTPRDANWLGDENHTCLVRQELVHGYQRQIQIDTIQKKMETFQKDNEKLKAEKMPKIEEGKEATEEQKKEIAKISTEFEQMNIKKINEITSEMENMVFNTNVFKNVQLAMSEEEKKVEEDKVRDLAKFIKDKAIANLIARLEQNQYESVPSDSSTLKDLFHSNGINIRYLGYIADQVKDNKKLIYFKYMLEREVVIRCIKHILNQYIRQNETSELLGAMISHIFNCLLAPKEFIKKLDEGDLNFEAMTVKQIADEHIEELNLNNNKADNKVQQDAPIVSKKEKLRQKKAKANEAQVSGEQEQKNEQEQETKSFTHDIGELLFKSPYDDLNFEANELFMEPTISMNVCESQLPEVFQLTPKKLYQQIKDLAEKRYKYTSLPKKLVQLQLYERPANKMSVLRDICQCTGIVINFSNNKQYIFENDLEKLKVQLSNMENQKRNKTINKKGKGRQAVQDQQVFSDDELFVYENLPFSPNDIADFFPILKTLPLHNKDVNALMQEANMAVKQEQLERGFDLYGQTINILLQITGAMNNDVASCISKMANIQYKLGDYLQAIELQSKSIIISEKLFGYDHPSVAYNYSNLALYYHTCQFFTKGFEYLHKSLKILQVVCGENHPDLASIYLNLGLMYQDCENLNAAIDCFMDSLYRSIDLHGATHVQVSQCYQAIAHAYFLLNDFRLALEYQEKSHVIIKQLADPQSPMVYHSQRQLDTFMQHSVNYERQKKAEKSAQGIGSGKRAIGANNAKLTDKERDDLEKRQRVEAYIKKLQEGTLGQGAKPGAKQQGMQPERPKPAGFLDQLEQKLRIQQYHEHLKKQTAQAPQVNAEAAMAAAAQKLKVQSAQSAFAQPAQPQQAKETALAKAARELREKMPQLNEESVKEPSNVTPKQESVPKTAPTASTEQASLNQNKKKKGKK